MSVFSRYADYYDLTYAEKDYSAEVEFIFRKSGLPQNQLYNVLELGCGTGRHAIEFIRRGHTVVGVDASAQMIKIARQAIPTAQCGGAAGSFQVADVRNVRLGAKFDLVVSLFHVFSYQVTNADLKSAFRTAAQHLAPEGRLFVDFWYGPAVLSDPPEIRVRRITGNDFSVTRTAEPQSFPNENRVDVKIKLEFESAKGEVSCVKECHTMRYLFLPEIEEFLAGEGLQLLGNGKWMSDNALGLDSWYGWIVAGHSNV